jgi:predicted cupin superfamily sugar epimerase
VHAINKEGAYLIYELSDTNTGSLSVVIPAGWWFAAEIPSAKGFVLVSCAVAPAFDFAEFEMAGAEMLSAKYPQHEQVIKRFCRC